MASLQVSVECKGNRGKTVEMIPRFNYTVDDTTKTVSDLYWELLGDPSNEEKFQDFVLLKFCKAPGSASLVFGINTKLTFFLSKKGLIIFVRQKQNVMVTVKYPTASGDYKTLAPLRRYEVTCLEMTAADLYRTFIDGTHRSPAAEGKLATSNDDTDEYFNLVGMPFALDFCIAGRKEDPIASPGAELSPADTLGDTLEDNHHYIAFIVEKIEDYGTDEDTVETIVNGLFTIHASIQYNDNREGYKIHLPWQRYYLPHLLLSMQLLYDYIVKVKAAESCELFAATTAGVTDLACCLVGKDRDILQSTVEEVLPTATLQDVQGRHGDPCHIAFIVGDRNSLR